MGGQIAHSFQQNHPALFLINASLGQWGAGHQTPQRFAVNRNQFTRTGPQPTERRRQLPDRIGLLQTPAENPGIKRVGHQFNVSLSCFCYQFRQRRFHRCHAKRGTCAMGGCRCRQPRQGGDLPILTLRIDGILQFKLSLPGEKRDVGMHHQSSPAAAPSARRHLQHEPALFRGRIAATLILENTQFASNDLPCRMRNVNVFFRIAHAKTNVPHSGAARIAPFSTQKSIQRWFTAVIVPSSETTAACAGSASSRSMAVTVLCTYTRK